MDRFRSRLGGRAAGALLAAATLVGALASASSTAGASPAATKRTATWGEQAFSPPNWIFPFTSLVYYSTANLQDFQYLMYRPLYWFGDGTNPLVDEPLSLAALPSYSKDGRSVVIDLKGWRWSDGQKVDAQSVIFWMNMLRAEKIEWAGYYPGELPDNVVSVSAPSPRARKVTITMDRRYNHTWLLYNELSQITPLPEAWDVNGLTAGQPKAPGSGGCSAMHYSSTVAAHCRKVWLFLTDDNGQAKTPKEAGDLKTYATNPLWQVVDGPWRLRRFDATNGSLLMSRNRRYSGPVTGDLSRFAEVPSESTGAEYSQLVHGTVDVGALPVSEASRAPRPGEAGPNPSAIAGRYTASIQPSWTVDFAYLNFNSTAGNGTGRALIRQLYIRQALQELTDQTSIIKRADKGYGVPTDGPVPSFWRNPFVSSAERKDPYGSVGLGAVEVSLRDHGWTVPGTGGVDTCAAPAKCGAGIPKGTELSLHELVVSGSPSLEKQVDIERTDAAKAGIRIVLKFESFDAVLGATAPCSPSQGAACRWEMVDWGGGWLYEPDYYPTGEFLFKTGAGSNAGSYSSRVDDHLINETVRSNEASAFSRWENYITREVPVIWQPLPVGIVETAKSLRGFSPNIDGGLTPEDWSFAG
jgi:peptide/nickel transport system substrate-binding protein